LAGINPEKNSVVENFVNLAVDFALVFENKLAVFFVVLRQIVVVPELIIFVVLAGFYVFGERTQVDRAKILKFRKISAHISRVVKIFQLKQLFFVVFFQIKILFLQSHVINQIKQLFLRVSVHLYFAGVKREV
jgi:hypothetical protein